MYLCAICTFPGLVCLFGCSKKGRPIPRIYRSFNWETEHYNSVLEIKRPRAVSFLGIPKLKPHIYIGFSPVLHLQCIQVCPTAQNRNVTAMTAAVQHWNYATVTWNTAKPRLYGSHLNFPLSVRLKLFQLLWHWDIQWQRNSAYLILKYAGCSDTETLPAVQTLKLSQLLER
jgi:hypothetical protein